MIEAYFRPANLEEAIRILEQDPAETYPLGGGNVLSRLDEGKIKVVDLQKLKLDTIEVKGGRIVIGANTPLQSLIEDESVPVVIKDAARREGTINNRRTSTIAGVLVSSAGQSPLGAVLIALGTTVILAPRQEAVQMEKWMGSLDKGKPARLVTSIEAPMPSRAAYLDISKTPEDVPLVYSVLSKSEKGELTWVICLSDRSPFYIGKGMDGEIVLKNAHSHYISLKLSNNYTLRMVDVLFERLSAQLSKGGRA